MKLLLLLLCVTQLGCATTASSDTVEVSDPFESFNRAMWTFNYEYLDPYLVRPVSVAYVNYTPSFVRSGISNVLSNIEEPASAVNNLFMGNGELALQHVNRFWINTTFGVAGLMDVASSGGIEKVEERVFSDTVGRYGVGNGWYFMMPAYGPVTLRESLDLVDGLYPPLSYLTIWASVGKWFFEGMESRVELIAQEELLENSPDPYAFTRDVYIQRRNYRSEVNQQEWVDEAEEDLFDEYLEEY